MSSYFDEMGRRIAQALQEHNAEKVQKLVDTVKQRVANYLAWIERNALKSEREKVAYLKKHYEEIVNRGSPYGPEFLVSGDLHTLGHSIGGARIKLRGGRTAGDSPYYTGHYGVD